MIAELRRLVTLFQRVDYQVEEMLAPIAARLGLTDERVKQMAAEMMGEFLAEATKRSNV